MTDPIDSYVASLRRELRGVPDAGDIVSELEDHLREAADALVLGGSPSHLAAREAVQRFGRPGLVARSIRAARLQPSHRDPAPVRRWVFGLTECLLILAALSATAALYLHWLPCGGDAITPTRIQDACLTRMDTSWAFPFAPEAGERGLVTDAFRLAALLLLTLGWSALTFGQPWRPLVRLVVALPILPLLTMAADTAWLMADPAAEPHWWTEAAATAMDLFALAAFGAGVILAAPLHERTDRHGQPVPIRAAISYGSFRWRVALLLCAVSATSRLRAYFEYFTFAGFSDLNWDTPPGTGYLIAGSIAVCALSSLLLGLFARRPQPLDESVEPSRPEAPALVIPEGAR